MMSDFGNLVARVTRRDGDVQEPVVVRLGRTLYWTYSVDKQPLSEDLHTWARLPCGVRKELALARDGSVVVHEMAPDRNIVKLEYWAEDKNKTSTLELDFGDQVQAAKSWYNALHFMVTPWKDLLTETNPVLGGGLHSSPGRDPPDGASSAEKWEERLRGAVDRLMDVNQHNEKFAKFLGNIIKVLDVQQDFVKEVLVRLPLVGASFQLLAFGLSCSAKILALSAEKKLEYDIRKEMAYIAGLTVREMLQAAERGSEGAEHMEELSKIMEKLEFVVRKLDAYIVSHILKRFLKKLLPADTDLLSELQKTLGELKQEVRAVQTWEGIGELRSRQRRIEDLITKNEGMRKVDHQEILKEFEKVHRGPRKGDKWTACFTAPKVAQFVIKNAVVKKLRDTVLKAPSRGVLAAIGVKGDGGVGKTVACTVVANDPEVRAKFVDGVLWMRFGIDFTAQKASKELVGIIESSGGISVAENVKSTWGESMENAVAKASSWFRDRRVLIVADNVWPAENEEDEVDWVVLLSSLVGQMGCLLFSTRSDDVGSTLRPLKVEFGPLSDRDASVEMFEKHLQIGGTEERYNVDARDRILEICAGLPLALATAARLVQRARYRWESIVSDLDRMLMEAKSADPGGHPGLASTISLTLVKLDKKELGGTFRDWVSCRYSWSEMYYALAVMPNYSTSMPVGILGLLWGLSKVEATRVAIIYSELGLASIDEDDIVRVHDLQWLFCHRKCRDKSSWHGRLVRAISRLPRQSVEALPSEVQGREIVEVLVSNLDESPACSEYLIDNAARHVTMAGSTLISLQRLLFTDYRWIRRKAGRRGLLSVAADYAFAVSAAKVSEWEKHTESAKSSSCLGSDDLEGYKAIESALRKIPYDVTPGYKVGEGACPVHGERGEGGPDSGLAGQLIGRLAFKYSVRSSMPNRRADVQSATAIAENTKSAARLSASEDSGKIMNCWRFWRGISGCFRSKCRKDESSVANDNETQHGQRVNNKNEFPHVANFQNSVVSKLLSSVEKEAIGPWLCPLTDHFGSSASKSDRVIQVGGGYVLSTAMSAGDKFVYSGCFDGVVRKHDVTTGKLVSELVGHVGYVQSVAVATGCSNGCEELVVSGSRDHTIRCWAMPLNECIQTLEGHSGTVRSVAVSKDGSRIVSGSDDETVGIWDRQKNGSWMLQARLTLLGEISLVLLSEDGLKVAFFEQGQTSSVQLWRESEDKSNTPEKNFKRIATLSESCRGPFIFADTEDMDVIYLSFEGVHLWKRDRDETFLLISHHFSYPRCISASSGAERRIIAVGDRNTILVWQLEEAELLYKLSGHYALVRSVIITGGGQRIISGADDGTIRAWSIGASDERVMSTRPSYGPSIAGDRVTHVTTSEDGSTIVTVHDEKKIQIWSEERGCWKPGEEFKIFDVVLSRNGEIAVASNRSENSVVFWNCLAGEAHRVHLDVEPGKIAISRNGRYFAACSWGKECEVWSIEACKLVKAYSDLPGARDALNRYAHEYGLDEGACPSRDYSIPGLSHSSSGSIVCVTRSNPSTIGEGESTSKACSCAARAIFEGPLDDVVMLPHVSGLDLAEGMRKTGIGMIGVKCQIGRRWTFEFLEIIK